MTAIWPYSSRLLTKRADALSVVLMQDSSSLIPVARTPTPISAAASTEARSRLGFASPRTDTVPTTSPALIGVVLLSMRNQICSQNYKIEIRREK